MSVAPFVKAHDTVYGSTSQLPLANVILCFYNNNIHILLCTTCTVCSTDYTLHKY